jgi:hypothetical protein
MFSFWVTGEVLYKYTSFSYLKYPFLPGVPHFLWLLGSLLQKMQFRARPRPGHAKNPQVRQRSLNLLCFVCYGMCDR